MSGPAAKPCNSSSMAGQTSPGALRIARLGGAARSPRLSLKTVARDALLNFALGALFPRLSYRLRWVARAGPRGIAAYVGAATLMMLAVDWMVRAIARGTLERDELRERLRKELGRPPWPEEIDRAWMESHGWDPDLADALR
jgi:hypothetical protein